MMATFERLQSVAFSFGLNAMIDPTRQELLDVLAEVSDQCPEMRFGQLIANLATLARGPEIESIWDSEDAELLAAAREQLETFLSRQPAAS